MSDRMLLPLAAAMLLLAIAACAGPTPDDGAGAGQQPSASGSVSPEAAPTATVGGAEVPRNHVDNNSWKQRTDLSAADLQVAQQAADRVQPALEAQRAGGDVSVTTTRATLIGLGFAPERVVVRAMNDPTYPGAAYGIEVGERACVIGSVRPERISVQVTGSAAEFGCLEPVSH